MINKMYVMNCLRLRPNNMSEENDRLQIALSIQSKHVKQFEKFLTIFNLFYFCRVKVSKLYRKVFSYLFRRILMSLSLSMQKYSYECILSFMCWSSDMTVRRRERACAHARYIQNDLPSVHIVVWIRCNGFYNL